MKGIIAMKDDDQRFVVQAVHMLLEGGSRATPSADRTPENSYDPSATGERSYHKHLASTVHRVDGAITEWLKRREQRRCDKTASAANK
jgi:hypothetical protein